MQLIRGSDPYLTLQPSFIWQYGQHAKFHLLCSVFWILYQRVLQGLQSLQCDDISAQLLFGLKFPQQLDACSGNLDKEEKL